MSGAVPRFPVAWFVVASATASVAATWLAWPGFVSSDAQAAWGQAVSASYDTVHPPLLAWLWRQALRISDGPGMLLATFHGLYCAGLALALALVDASALRRTLAFAILVAWPPLLVLLCHLWKDVGMAAALAAASGLTLAWRARHWQAARAGAIALLLVAVALRHNAWTAALPLAWLLATRTGASGRRRAIGATALALLLLAFPTLVARGLYARERVVWPAVALWDLAAISIEVDRQLLPASVVAPELDVPALRRWFSPWSNPSLFGSNLVLLGFYNDYTPAQLADVRHAWRDAIQTHPGAWLRHRGRVARWQFGGFPAAVPSTLVYSAEYRVPAGEAPVVAPTRPLRDALVAWTERARGGPWFWGAGYMVVAAFVLAWPRARRAAHGMAGALALSALLYAAPLPLLAPGAEWRYLMWAVVAALLAAVLVVSSPRAS